MEVFIPITKVTIFLLEISSRAVPQKGLKVEETLKTILVKTFAKINIVEVVDHVAACVGKPLSKSEIRRRIKDGAVYINNEKKTDPTEEVVCGDEDLFIKWGKRGNIAILSACPWEKRTVHVKEMTEEGHCVCSAEDLIVDLHEGRDEMCEEKHKKHPRPATLSEWADVEVCSACKYKNGKWCPIHKQNVKDDDVCEEFGRSIAI